MENGGVIKWFFRMEALRSSSEENLLGMTNLLNLKKNYENKISEEDREKVL